MVKKFFYATDLGGAPFWQPKSFHQSNLTPVMNVTRRDLSESEEFFEKFEKLRVLSKVTLMKISASKNGIVPKKNLQGSTLKIENFQKNSSDSKRSRRVTFKTGVNFIFWQLLDPHRGLESQNLASNRGARYAWERERRSRHMNGR